MEVKGSGETYHFQQGLAHLRTPPFTEENKKTRKF